MVVLQKRPLVAAPGEGPKEEESDPVVGASLRVPEVGGEDLRAAQDEEAVGSQATGEAREDPAPLPLGSVTHDYYLCPGVCPTRASSNQPPGEPATKTGRKYDAAPLVGPAHWPTPCV